MRIWSKLLAVVMVFSLAGIAEAKAKGKKDKGVSGTITAIDATSGTLTIDAGSKKTGVGKSSTVTTGASTAVTIDGVPGKKVSDLVVGEKVKVKASGSGAATSIDATSKATKHKKKK